ncbi:uncharacterized protein LOC120275475 isoform X3 [Dioscorea cayenensis subsp. rotundata]|uniref:Uncharacterized protein LOC120275475 isoform X3 n=1 Tax=Dioscorea cayennensis subsp. rotundata TaxID=55577 RepID=A0AB40CIC3_DIOCR|nr:uncharacterized protein LOC120275475 isoform X3 [Dioscorea cayenensis subsp. rotundata]
MAALSLVTPTSPNSVRLCFRRRCWVRSAVIIRLRSLKPDRRLRLDCACWASSNSSQDSFSGWSSEKGGDGSPKEERFGGMVGAGLAVLFFASGVAFAALSLSSRNANRVKPQMESIAVEQEVLLTSDDENKRMEQDGNYQSRQLMESDNKINDQNSDIETALQVSPGNVLVPAVVDQVQGQAFAALQVLKVIEADVQPGDLCTRREYARWLVTASSALSRNTASKVYPAMYIENVTELAFDDITPEDPDFACIQGLAEAGLISSKLSMPDVPSGEHNAPVLFSPESPLCRQDLVSWKMVLEKRQLLEVDKNSLYKCSGYLDIEKINPEAWPALVADLSGGEQGIIALAFGYTRLFQPYKPVTKAQAAIALATGDAADVVGEELTRIEAESLAETAVNAHTALVAQVEKDLNASFENELAKEREKIGALERLAEEARLELERLRTEREEENNALLRGRAAVESEIEVLSKLRLEVEEQLQNLMSDKVGISFERDRINKLREQAERENQVIAQLQYELDVEKKALSMARTWAEEEAKRARENARALEAARDRWEGRGIKVVVDEDLQDDASAGITWVSAGEQVPDNETTINRAENLVETLKAMASELKLRSSAVINNIYQKINSFISALKQQAVDASKHAAELRSSIILKGKKSVKEIQEKASDFGANVGYRTKRAFEDCKESVEKLQQKFKT